MEHQQNPTAAEMEALATSLNDTTNPLSRVMIQVREIHGIGSMTFWHLLEYEVSRIHRILFPEAHAGRPCLRYPLDDDSGATMAEYAILLAVITVALISILAAYTDAIQNIFTSITNHLNAAGGGS